MDEGGWRGYIIAITPRTRRGRDFVAAGRVLTSGESCGRLGDAPKWGKSPVARKYSVPLPETDVIDRSRANTGYWERSQQKYKGDYKYCVYILTKWINGEIPRPLFRELREGHLAALREYRLLDKYKLEDFQDSQEKQRVRNRLARWSKKDISNAIEDSSNGWKCFGCRREIMSNEDVLKSKPPVKIHNDPSCRRMARYAVREIVEIFKEGERD